MQIKVKGYLTIRKAMGNKPSLYLDFERATVKEVLDAAGRIVAPGFIDLMGQSSLVLITNPVSAESKLRQGITT